MLLTLYSNSINPLQNDNILDWSKLKQFADDNFKFDENSRKFSKQVENTVGIQILLTITKQQHFRLVQIETVCRRQF